MSETLRELSTRFSMAELVNATIIAFFGFTASVAAMGLILAVGFLNRRDDPREQKPPPDTQ